MKKIIYLFLLLFIVFSAAVRAQTPPVSTASSNLTPTLSASEEKLIQEFKTNVATQVAQYQQKNNRAIAGFMESYSNNIMKIKNDSGDEYSVKIDDNLTKFYQVTSTDKTEIKLADIKTGQYVFVTGVINGHKIDANEVYEDDYFITESGKITEVNKTDYYVSVLTNDKETITLDIESYTKQQLMDIKTLALSPIGFSKIKSGDTIHFVVKKTGKEREKNRYSALKMIIIPQEFFIK